MLARVRTLVQQEAIVNAMENVLLGLGESHLTSVNLGMITDSLKELKEAGATYLAVELSQKQVEDILKTGKGVRSWNSEEMDNMILTAHNMRLTVMGVDNKKVNDGYGVASQNAPNLSNLPLTAGHVDGQKYGHWDMVIAYPLAMSDPNHPSYRERTANK